MIIKNWKAVEERPHGRAIYGINGKYIWENKNGDILEIGKVVGGGTAINLYKKSGDIRTLPKEGIGFRLRKKAISYAKKWMKEHPNSDEI